MANALEVALAAASAGAAVAAVGVAFYSIRAGYKNTLRANDRERRREHYAQYLASVSELRDILEELQRLFHRLIKETTDFASKSASNPAVSSPDVGAILNRILLWATACINGSEGSTAAMLADLRRQGFPEQFDLTFVSMGDTLLRLSKCGRPLALSVRVLSLSGTPDEIVEKANALVDAMTEELSTFVDARAPPDWDRFDHSLESLEALMKRDLGRDVVYE